MSAVLAEVGDLMDTVVDLAVSQFPRDPAVALLFAEVDQVTELAIQGAPDGMVWTAFEEFKSVARELGVESELLA